MLKSLIDVGPVCGTQSVHGTEDASCDSRGKGGFLVSEAGAQLESADMITETQVDPTSQLPSKGREEWQVTSIEENTTAK